MDYKLAGGCDWIRGPGAEGNIVDIEEEFGQIVTEVKIAFPMSDKTLSCIALIRFEE